MTRVFHHRIETVLPLSSRNGVLEISGWCIASGLTRAPDLKLACARGEIRVLHRRPRPDVAAVYGVTIAGDPWGFQLEGELPPGAHLLTLFAAESGSDEWHALQRLTATVLSRGLQASVEYPPEPVLRQSVRIQGWCVHPEKCIREVWLHYGTRRVACEFGLPRTDVPAFSPGAPDARNSGFVTTKNAVAGRGPLRVVALDATGMRHVARPDRTVDINQDEENPRGLNLPERLARVSPARRVPALSTSRTTAPQTGGRILFVLYGDLTSNSAIHVAALANAMTRLGHECVVAVPEHPETLSYHHGALFRAVGFGEVLHDGRIFSQAQPPDLIHAWTTRETVRRFCEPLRAATGARLVVHLEDHELRILELNLGRPLADLLKLPRAELDRLVPATLSHPQHSREFLSSADGVTLITEKLRELLPHGPPVHLFWPAAEPDAFFPRPIPRDLRAALGFDANHTVLFYHGNVHPSNRGEMRELYLAVARLNAEGQPTTLLRSGLDSCDFLGPDAGECARHVLALGQIKHHQLPPLLALADFFVQPGEADAFNEYRFPSKLPEFFALGRPVILPRVNLGRAVRHGEDAYVLEKADASGIAGAVRTLCADPVLRERLSAGAAAFAEKRFSWNRSAQGLLDFYKNLRREPSAGDTPVLHARQLPPPS